MAEFHFLYQPVDDLDAAVRFYTSQLDFEPAWTDADISVGMWMPSSAGQVMLSKSGRPAGPMYLVDDVDDWLRAHRDIEVAVERGAAGHRFGRGVAGSVGQRVLRLRPTVIVRLAGEKRLGRGEVNLAHRR